MNIQLGRSRTVRRAYGIDEIALVPGGRTVDPEVTDSSWSLGGIQREIPIIASAMDGVVDVGMCIELTRLGALGVLNLEGVQCRYDDPEPDPRADRRGGPRRVRGPDAAALQPAGARGPDAPAHRRDQGRRRHRRRQRHPGGGPALRRRRWPNRAPTSSSSRPRWSPPSTSDRKVAESLDLAALCRDLGVPVVIGNCVTYEVSLQLMRAGAAGVMVGIGPGAACTSRGVLGVGIPQATAVADCAAARDDHEKESGRYVPVVADGGIVTGGDICKCLACGADAVMIGSPIARAAEAPGRGFHWGMATPSPVLPRGTRIRVGTTGSLEKILRGPAGLDDGTQNLLGCIRTSMGTLGARTLKEMRQVEVVVAPSLLTEGKVYQKAQQLGMGK